MFSIKWDQGNVLAHSHRTLGECVDGFFLWARWWNTGKQQGVDTLSALSSSSVAVIFSSTADMDTEPLCKTKLDHKASNGEWWAGFMLFLVAMYFKSYWSKWFENHWLRCSHPSSLLCLQAAEEQALKLSSWTACRTVLGRNWTCENGKAQLSGLRACPQTHSHAEGYKRGNSG